MSISNSKLNQNSASLGIYTKSASNRSASGLENEQKKRLERYCLQDIVSKLLPKERVTNCLKRRITKDTGVKVLYNPVREKAHYGNLVRCGSVWHCPVCAVQISEKRKKELQLAMANFEKMGGSVYLMTLTNSHNVGDNLAALLEGQKKALKYFWSDRKSKEMLSYLGKVGHIIATEVTYGENGWHPHYHVLMFFSKSVDLAFFKTFFADCWLHCCKKAKLPLPSHKHGLDFQDGSYAQNYISKWGLEDEMTKGHLKKGRVNGLTPFDLLRQSVENSEYEKLFQQYAISFKGKRQLFWSKGLKNLLGIFEQTDEQLAEETEQVAVELRDLALQIWRLITKYSCRSEFLECIEKDVFDGGTRADDLVMKLAGYEVDTLNDC